MPPVPCELHEGLAHRAEFETVESSVRATIYIQMMDDVLSLALKYVPSLKKAGDKWIGLCPFHAEKTASFFVDSDRFRCFGCGRSGDADEFAELLGDR